MSPQDLRASASEPATLSAVLDHLLADETLLMVFAANTGISPDHIAPARNHLAGPPPVWDT